ncbi:MAG: hypothetical protein AB2L24_10565 [Mangrovibacterium sp.]
MTKITNNVLTSLLSGKFGKLVFRKHGNKVTAYFLSPQKDSPSEKQRESRQDFAEAVALAKQALSDEAGRRKFGKLAKKEKKTSAYGAAVSYFYKQVHTRNLKT